MYKEKLVLNYNLQFFAQEGSGGEKTEEATSKKIEDSRADGQVAKSQELSMAVCLFVLFLSIRVTISYLGNGFMNEFRYMYRKIPSILDADMNIQVAQGIMIHVILTMLKIMAPLLAAGFVTAFLVNRLQIKWKVTGKPLKPKISNMNPIKGFKKIISMKSIVELIKSVAKVLFISYIVYNTLIDQTGVIYLFYDMSLNASLGLVGDIVLDLGMKISASLLIIGFADYFYQKHKLKKDLKMSKQEVKDEMKNSDGDPQIKQRIQGKMREASQRRMMKSVPTADVIITNPTHFAVAIKYDQEAGRAPIVVAKGADRIAAKIKEMAKENHIEIVENKALARMLYYNVEIDAEIPAELYQSVAEVLAYVYKLKNI